MKLTRRPTINEFLDDLFGDQEGIVYSPAKQGKSFKQYFFEWPQERDQLEAHLNDFNKRDVYVSPVLFNSKVISPESFLGTQYLWTEFDGNTPNDFIPPTMRVMSSQEGHEHWYWKLDHFETNKAIVEDLTRRIAYHYEADLSVWDYQNVLRPIDTWNHKRNKPVVLLEHSDKVYRIENFIHIPIPDIGTRVAVKLGELPPRDHILAKYRFKEDTLDLLFKDIPEGSRSNALARLACDAIEAGCSNEETYVLLEERDSVWGKYTGRSDREKQLQNCISYAHSRKSKTADINQSAPEVYRFYDFMQTTIKLKWAIEGLLPVAGSMVVFGSPGIGKSTFSLRLAIDLALGRDRFLLWKIMRPQRVLFISLEMQHYEVKEFFEDMKLPQETQMALQEQFYIWPIGAAYPFDTPDQQIELIKYIKLHKIELIIIDSLGLSMYGSVSDDNDVKRLNSFLNEDVRRNLNCGYMFIHHPRKRTAAEQTKDVGQDDAFGSQYIVANAQTVVILSSKTGSPRIKVALPKTRMSLQHKEFEIERTSDRGFKLVGVEFNDSTNANGIVQSSESQDGDPATDKNRPLNSLGSLFAI